MIDQLLAFVFSVLCFQIFTVKLTFRPKNGSDLCSIYSKLDFWKIFIRNYFFILLTDFKSLLLHNNIVNTSEILNQVELLENLHYFLHNLHQLFVNR